MQQLRTQLQQLAAHSSAVLLVGEPGSGREALRALSARAKLAQCAFHSCRSSQAVCVTRTVSCKLFGREEAGFLEEVGNGTLFI